MMDAALAFCPCPEHDPEDLGDTAVWVFGAMLWLAQQRTALIG